MACATYSFQDRKQSMEEHHEKVQQKMEGIERLLGTAPQERKMGKDPQDSLDRKRNRVQPGRISL